MSTRILVPALLVPALLLAVVALGLALRDQTPAPVAEAPPPPSGITVTSERGEAAPAGESAARAEEVHWGLRYSHQAAIDGHGVLPTTVEGEWRVTALGADRQRVEFVPTHIDGAEDLPTLNEARVVFELGLTDGRLDTIGFPRGTSDRAADVLTALATTFSYTAGPAGADRWTVEEEDRIGWYAARYRRDGHGVTGHSVTRTRGPWRALRSTRLGSPDRLTPSGGATYVFDDAGLAEITVESRIELVLHPDLPTATVDVHGSLTRLDRRPVAPSEPKLAQAEIRAERQGDPALARRRADSALLEDTTPEALLASVFDPALVGTGEAARNGRIDRYKKVRALLRLRPEAVADVAATLQQAAHEAPDTVGTLAGAMAQAGEPAAVDALTGLLAGPLPQNARTSIVRALGGADPVTPAAADALGEMLETGEQPAAAPLAAGSAAARLEDQGEDQRAGDLIDQLLAQYRGATDRETRRALMTALGNTGSLRVLPTLMQAFGDPDPVIRGTALYSMRGIPDPSVDALIERALLGPFAFVAVQCAGHRDPATWLPRLEIAARRLSGPAQQHAQRTVAIWQRAHAMAANN